MLNMNNRGCRQRFLHLSDLSGKIEGDSVRRVVEHYRRVTIDVFFGSTVKRRSAMCINFVNVEVTIYCRSFLCSVRDLRRKVVTVRNGLITFRVFIANK